MTKKLSAILLTAAILAAPTASLAGVPNGTVLAVFMADKGKGSQFKEPPYVPLMQWAAGSKNPVPCQKHLIFKFYDQAKNKWYSPSDSAIWNKLAGLTPVQKSGGQNKDDYDLLLEQFCPDWYK